MTFRWLSRAAGAGDPVDLSALERHLVDAVERSFAPRPELVVRTPEHLLTRFRAAAAQSTPFVESLSQAPRPALSRRVWQLISGRSVRTTAVVAFFTIACSFAASAAVVPGRPLYGFRLAVETLSLPPAGTALRLEARADRLAERLDEARQSALSGDPSGIVAAVDAYAAEVRDLRLDLRLDRPSAASRRPSLGALLDAQASELAGLIAGHGDDVRLAIMSALRENVLARMEVQSPPETDGASGGPPAGVAGGRDAGDAASGVVLPDPTSPAGGAEAVSASGSTEGASRGASGTAPGQAKKASPSPETTPDPAVTPTPGVDADDPVVIATPGTVVAAAAPTDATPTTITSAPGASGTAPGHTKGGGSAASPGKSGSAPGHLKKVAVIAEPAPAIAEPASSASGEPAPLAGVAPLAEPTATPIAEASVAPPVEPTATPTAASSSAPGSSGSAPGHNKD